MTTDIERGGVEVSGSHEPSYYEIALTNRQVVVAFVILLTCVVAAFLAGVWIGRESAARAQQRLAMLAGGDPGRLGATPANGGDAARNDPKQEKPDGQALQEFKFFADPHHRPGSEANGGNGEKGANGGHGSSGANGAKAGSEGAGETGGPRERKSARPANAAASSTLAEDLGRRAGAGNPANPPLSAIPPVTPTGGRRAPVAGAGQGAQSPAAAGSAPASQASAAGIPSASSKSSAGQPGVAARSAAAAGDRSAASGRSRGPGGPGAPGGRSMAAGPAGSADHPAPTTQASAAAPEPGDEAGPAAGAGAPGAPGGGAGEGEPLAEPGARAAGAGSDGKAGAAAGKARPGTAAASGKSNISWSPAGVAGASELVIQVFSTADKEQADKVRDRLVEAGFTAFLSPIAKAGGQTMYRVRIGPFASRAAADGVAEKVRKEQKLDTWITPK
jgi:cell division septation protein DedD